MEWRRTGEGWCEVVLAINRVVRAFGTLTGTGIGETEAVGALLDIGAAADEPGLDGMDDPQPPTIVAAAAGGAASKSM